MMTYFELTKEWYIMLDVVELTKKLVSFDTVNPPGNEAIIARFTGDLLEKYGFIVNYFEYGTGRLHMIAEKGLNGKFPPLVLSGHFDTVHFRTDQWSTDPLGGEIRGNRIYGRGTCDMKGALAAMLIAGVDAFSEGNPAGGIRFFFTAGEESGCSGILDFKNKYREAGVAKAIIVGEPTDGKPAIAHKGAIYFNVITRGRPAHSSMPHLGENAIFKAAESIVKLKNYDSGTLADPLLGKTTLNVGVIRGGTSINIVPDKAEFTIDVRTNSVTDHGKVINDIISMVGDGEVEILVNHKAIATSGDNRFVKLVHDICGVNSNAVPFSVPYLTDGSVLQDIYPGAPVVILGPGDPSLAHRNDEYCDIDKLRKAVKTYKEIILQCNLFN